MASNGQLSRTSNTKQNSSKDGALSYVDGVFDRTSTRLASSRQWATAKASDTLDKAISPAQRDALTEKTQRFIQTNPRLAAFIAVNVVLTGIPILLFLLFSASIFVFSVTTGLVLGTISALVFTSTVVGLALLVIVPTVFFTTIAAGLLFFWGLVGFTVLRWAANTRRQVAQRSESLNDQVRSVRNRIAESAEAASDQRSKSNLTQSSDNDQSKAELGDTRHTTKDSASRTAPATALPTDRQATINVSAGKGAGSGTFQVPDTSTTGMVAS